jgi:two-component system, NtrC family, sensor histidine kinase HydH
MGLTFFESIKQYVGFTDQSSAALRDFHPIAEPFFGPIIDDFYDAIESHPGASAAITGGQPQIERLKRTLVRWLDTMLVGPHDEAYYEMRARIGRVHVRIALPQAFMFTAMDRIRIRLLDVAAGQVAPPDATQVRRISTALHQILDLELAIMLETYREDLVTKNRNAERLATIGQFAASIGHELRNPLGVMESSLFLLRQHLGPEAAGARNVVKHLDRIGGEITRANKTIHDLLDLARNRPPQRERTDIRTLVKTTTAVALLPPGVAIEITTPSGLTVEVDRGQFQQVLINLFTNASQSMGGEGRISVEGEALPSGGARLRVRDNGPGVPAEVRHRIFEALFTTKAKGSGLGLALCRRIIEAHGGTIELESTERGASFVITLPGPDDRKSGSPGSSPAPVV